MTTLTLLLVSVLLLVVQACAPQAMPTTDPNSIDTAIAQTMAAAPTRTTEPEVPVTGPDTPTATLSPSPELPTETSTALVLPTAIVTTPTTPEIRVAIPTNCRVGPGVAFDRVGGLQPGQVAEVLGRNETGNYWIIRDPNRTNVTCWLWGEYATVTGNTSVLPIYTPPPTPTPVPTATPAPTGTPAPSFGASYDGTESCTGTGWWVDLELQNSGGITFQSMSLIVTDTVTNTVLPLDAGNFVNRNGCNETDTRSNLPPATTRIVSSPVFNYDPAGNRLSARITLCSNPGLSGSCSTQIIDFTP